MGFSPTVNGGALASSSTSPKWINIAQKTNLLGQGLSSGDTTRQSVTYKVQHNASMKTGLLRLFYTNWYNQQADTNDLDGPNSITIGGSIEDSNGNIFQATFNGQQNTTLISGASILSDPISIVLNKGDTFYTRNYVSVSYSVANPSTVATVSNAATGGSIAAGTYYATYTWVTAAGETAGCTAAIPSTTTTGTTSTITVAVPAFPSNVTSANVYIGTTSGTQYKQGSISASGGSVTLTSYSTSGSTVPSSNNAGQKWGIGNALQGSPEGVSQGDATLSGSFTASSGEYAYHPVLIVGYPDASLKNATDSLIIFGDSITWGYGSDWMGDSFANIAQSTWGRSVIQAGVPGESVITVTNAYKRRLQLAQFATHALIYYGANDLFGGTETASTLETNVTNLANKLVQLGLKTYVATLIPRASSTDNWTTVANQSPTAGFEAGGSSHRGTYNAWVRTTPSPFSGYIEFGDVTESSRDSGAWKVNGTSKWATSDGTHPSNILHKRMAAALMLNNMFTGQTTTPATNANVPSGLSSDGNDGYATVSWTALTDPTVISYNVYRGGTILQSGLTNTKYPDSAVTGGTQYSYDVTSVDIWGHESAASANTSVTINAPAYVVHDTFTRANSTNALGSTESGTAGTLAWTAVTGTWGISNNQAYESAGTANALAVVNSGKSDCTVQVEFANIGASTNLRLVFRETDSNNYFVLQANIPASGSTQYQIWKNSAGSWSQLGTNVTNATPTNGDVVKVVLSGSTITAYVNKTQVLQVTDTFNQTAMNHGIGSSGNSSNMFDNFSVY